MVRRGDHGGLIGIGSGGAAERVLSGRVRRRIGDEVDVHRAVGREAARCLVGATDAIHLAAAGAERERLHPARRVHGGDVNGTPLLDAVDMHDGLGVVAGHADCKKIRHLSSITNVDPG